MRLRLRVFVGVVVVFFGFGVSATEVTVNWRSKMLVNDGIIDGARVELGTFGSFVPTRDNVGEWHEHWQVADQTNYLGSNGLFASTFDLDQNLEGGVYMWLADFEGNWILLTNVGWVWPDVNSGLPLPKDYFTTDGMTVAVVGSINQTSSVDHLGTEMFEAPGPSGIFQMWLEHHGLANGGGDPDGDGWSNFDEFVRGGDPNVVGNLNCVEIEVGNEVVVRLQGGIHPQVRVEVEESSDLESWSVGSFEVDSRSPDLVLSGPRVGAKRFYRVCFTLFGDGS